MLITFTSTSCYPILASPKHTSETNCKASKLRHPLITLYDCDQGTSNEVLSIWACNTALVPMHPVTNREAKLKVKYKSDLILARHHANMERSVCHISIRHGERNRVDTSSPQSRTMLRIMQRTWHINKQYRFQLQLRKDHKQHARVIADTSIQLGFRLHANMQCCMENEHNIKFTSRMNLIMYAILQ